MTMGAEMVPSLTSSLKRSPALWREPAPSQQMRAGRPWKWTLSLACWIQRARRSSSGKRSRIASSVAAMSPASPERAAHRNGPLPSQKSGYVGRDEAGVRESPVEAAQLRLRAQIIAVVEDPRLAPACLPSPRRWAIEARASPT